MHSYTRLSPTRSFCPSRPQQDLKIAMSLFWVVAACMFALVAPLARAQALPPSDRVTINLSAGMPGQGQWLYIKDSDSTSYATNGYNDSSWTPVGIPYSANLLTSFLNADSGGGDGDLNGTNNWYRLHFTLGTQYANSKVLVEFEGAHTGAQVYINGTLLPGISTVATNSQASHVVGFVPFIADLTPYLYTDGSRENVLAVRVSRNGTWFATPQFSEDYRFGQADAGLFRPAVMFITNQVHIPVNVYSNQKTWGTYVATVSEVPSSSGTAQAASAVIEVQTNVLNESTSSQQVTLTTQIVDAKGNVVASASPVTQSIAPMSSGNYPSSATPMFDQQITVNNPTLWYPNNSIYGTPYLYKVNHIVSVNGSVVDATQTNLGIRTITWDTNFPYFNGHPMYLWGGSGRYDYPALGSSVPEEQQWRDLQQIAAEGGNIWRPGHSTSSEEFVDAADAYGIMIDQPSGDGEGGFAAASADSITLKEELHRDMIIRDRSHPSILDWEANNGTMAESVGIALNAIAKQWDPINTRVEADRTPDPVNGYILGCTLEGCEVGIKTNFPNNPAWGSEYWGNGTGRGLGWDYELTFSAPFIDNWRKGRAANAFGMAQWYFADSPGEDSLYVEFNGNTAMQSMVRSLGASSVDMNRFPKLLYYVYQAAWTPYSLKPIVHLAHHWNRSGTVQENVFSNCPAVRLLINGVPQGSDQVPNPWNSDTSNNLTQSTTLMPFQASWSVNWTAGTVTAECLDQLGNVQAIDSRVTAGGENKIVLTTVPELVRPNGQSFAVTANGSDAAFVVASVEDANGNVVPTASDILTFSVNGPATYMGGSEQYVSTATDAYSQAHTEINYHAPGDPQLQVEGGLTKIALRSQFTAGTVTVTATAPGLATGTATFTIQPVASVLPAPAAPQIVVPPASTAVTVGQPATFTVTASGTAPLTFQWLKNGSAISGATSSSYTTPNTTSGDNNSSFTVTVTNGQGFVTSPAATLTVDAASAVSITTQPASQTAYVGQQVNLSVVASGSPTLTYQWLKGGAVIAGATSATYTTPVLTSGDNGDNFSVVVKNPVNSVTSANATLTVQPAIAPTITQQPASQSVLVNNPATFTVAVSGSSPFSYQWKLNGNTLIGATSSTFSILQVQSTNTGNYTVVVSNAAGSVTSAAAILTIAPPGVNLALNQPATSSSTQGTGLTANLVNDGNLSTRWASAGGVDPSWVEIDLGSVKAFDNVILYWDPAYASQYQIQYSNVDNNWNNPSIAYSTTNGVGGVENLTFPTVQGRYVRMYGTKRATPYGYSINEMQIYDIPQCGGSGERYTILSPTTVLDNVSHLTWQRAETTYANSGAQYTQPIAQSYCTSQNMRLPTVSEALGISGASSASCAFAQLWNTWTSTVDPSNSSDAGFVTSTGQSTWQVANNYPGAVLCDSGTVTVPTPPTPASGLNATTASSSQINLTWTASSTSGVTYSILRSTTAGAAGTQISSGQSGTAYSDTGLNASTTYYYEVEAVNSGGTSTPTTQISATTSSSGGGGGGSDVIAINAGGAATGSFSADEDFVGGGTYSVTNTINASAANAAPATVYQSERQGATTYTLPGLTAGTNYTVRLHFAELYFTTAGSRKFNVSINGTPVLTNFDIVATAGAAYTAAVETFTATANGSGQIVVSLSAGSADQPLINGIEILGSISVPSAPTGLNATTVSASQINLTWTASSTSGVTYNVYRSTTAGFTAGAGNQIAASQTSTSYVDMGLSASTTYYYLVEANNSAGNSTASNQTSATTQGNSGGGSDVLAINSGGPATGSFAADEDFTGGGTYGVTNTINVSAANAAPMGVYQSERQGTVTYTLIGLTSNNSYSVRLHFAELYFTTAGSRKFNVSINGTPVLTNFDIVASAGAAYTAVVETFTATANNSGQIVVSLSNGSADQPLINGIEVLGSVTTPVPNAPANLTASATSSSQINLSWTASTTTGVTYNVYRSTTSGFTPAAGNQVATGLTGTTYASTGLTASTTYYYAVEANNSAGVSAPSNQTSATTLTGGSGGTDIFAINAGGPVTGTFTADENFIGGGTYNITNTIDTSATNAAPAAVYQSARQGSFTYTLPGLVAGSTHTVRLHFAELYFSAVGQRIFNVSINGTAVLTNFDIVAAAGANDKAVVETFTSTANNSGQIVITTSNSTKDQPMLNGIEVQ